MELPITEEEIEFCECFYDPTALTECLMPLNENAPQTWDVDCECMNFYPYEIAMQNFAYLVGEDPELTPQEQMNKYKGAGDLFSIGARNLGKCEYEENLCQLADGSVKKFGDLIGTEQYVISFNDTTLKLEQDIATFYDNGNKPCYQIITDSGKEIIVTNNHPLYTENGWCTAETIKPTEYLATPREIKISGVDVDLNIAKIVGYLLGDGSCTIANKSITNINDELIAEFYELAEYFDCELTRGGKYSYHFRKNSIAKEIFGSRAKNNVQKICDIYGLNCLSKNKIIPESVFLWNNKAIATLLNRLYACDGCVHQHKSGYINIEICLASKKMIYQIQTLLLRFGIHSDIYFKRAICNNKIFPAWRLNVGHDAVNFLNLIGVKSKDKNLSFNRTYSTSDRIPNKFITSNYKDFLKKKELTLRSLKNYNPSRTKCQRISQEIGNLALYKISNSDIYWEKIKSIEYIGMKQTVMVSVDKNHTYISNNIISHNSYITKIDVLLQYIHKVKQACVSSFDDRHLRNVTNPIALFIESHPFLQIFGLKNSRSNAVKRDPLTVTSEHGSLIKGVNEQVDSPEPGVQFQSLHFTYLTIEETSYISEKGTKQRIDAGNATGYIERLSGIPDLRLGSPLTKILTDPKNKRKIWRLPQYVSPLWCEETKQKRIAEYSGENSSGYRLNVEAEILEGAYGFWDMARLKEKAIKQSRKIKYFEVGKENFHDFENRLKAIERLPGADQVYIISDIGLGHTPSEVIIVFRVGDVYKYVYQISLFKLIQKEQAQIFKWLYDKLGTAFISHDATSDGGATIDELIALGIPQEHLLKVKLNTNLEVDFEKDEKGQIVRNNNGEPLMKKVNAMEFAMQELERLLYSGKLEIAFDDKFLREFNGYIVKQTGLRKVYGSTTTDDLHQSFQILAIAIFFNENNPMENIKLQKRCYGVFK